MSCIKVTLSGCSSILSECVVWGSHNLDVLLSKWISCIKISLSGCSSMFSECFVLSKGNKKITELRTILQRESQNS